MKAGDTIEIERAANGWIVRPRVGGHMVCLIEDILVFNDMGELALERPKPSGTLLSFIAQHFAKS